MRIPFPEFKELTTTTDYTRFYSLLVPTRPPLTAADLASTHEMTWVTG